MSFEDLRIAILGRFADLIKALVLMVRWPLLLSQSLRIVASPLIS